MRRFWCLVAFAILSGCTWFVPSDIKTEIDFMNTAVQVGVSEAEGIEAITDDAKARAVAMKAVRALRRLAPHADNLKRWIEGKEPASD
jgi:hypothetical protein